MQRADSNPTRATRLGCSIRLAARRTGIAPATLRAWERRYGFPKPARRPGGSRVYTETDLAKLELLSRALKAGFRPGEVVPRSNGEIRRLLDLSASERASSVPAQSAAESSSRRLLDALLADDVVGVRTILRSVAAALGPQRFVTEFAHPLAVRIGELWAEGHVEVRHEHLVSDCLSTQLRLLFAGLVDGASREPSVVLATLPGEPHVLPLEMVAVYLAARQASPCLLGPDVPAEQIAHTARGMSAQAVGISISPAAERSSVSAGIRALRRALPQETQLWLGGGGQRYVRPAPRIVHVSSWDDLDAAVAESRRAVARSRG